MKTEQLAHTHIQLLNQLIKVGYNSSNLNFVFDAYQYCIELCDGFQACGKPFIIHLIRTASILVELNQDILIIVSGLLHSAYEFGDFGDGSRGIASWKQESVKQRMGTEVENYIQKYDALRWHDENILLIYGNLNQLNQIEKTVLLIRLANELEQCLDLEPLYRNDYENKIQQIQTRKDILIDMANQLGYPLLSNQLNQNFTLLLEVTKKVNNSHLRNSEFFSQMSSRFSLTFLLKKRIKGEVGKRTMGKVSSSLNN